MKTYYITWNEDRSEGFITDDRGDAVTARTGKKRRHRGYTSASTAAMAFFDTYGDDKLPPIQKVEIE